jgi:outer membrane protein assembly factor BamB
MAESSGVHKVMLRTRHEIVTAALLALAAVAAGDEKESPRGDWPQWRGPNRDGVVHGVSVPVKWPKSLKEEWSAPVPEGFSSSPVVVGSNVYVFARQKESELVLCLELASGKEKWRSEAYAAPYKPWPGEGPWSHGPRSTPTVAGGRIYTAGVSGVLSCLDATTGKLIWRKRSKTPPPYGGAMSPLVADGLCIVHVGFEGKEDGLTAFDAATGKVKWRLADGSRPAHGSPILVDLVGQRQVVAVTSSALVGLAATTGRKLWSVPLDGEHVTNSPILYKDLIIYADWKKPVRAFRLEKGKSGIAAKEVWEGNGPRVTESTPVVKEKLLFGASSQRAVRFFCLDADSGKTLWESEDRQAFGYTSILHAGSVVLFLTNKGRLVVAKPSATAFEPIAAYQVVSEIPIWAHPVFLGDRILIKDTTALRSFRIEQDGK